MGLGTVFMWYGNAKLMKFPFKIIFKFGYTPGFFAVAMKIKVSFVPQQFWYKPSWNLQILSFSMSSHNACDVRVKLMLPTSNWWSSNCY